MPNVGRGIELIISTKVKEKTMPIKSTANNFLLNLYL
jgi:hypothetical protein